MIERDKLKAAEQEKLKDQKTKNEAQIKEIDAKIAAAEQNASARASQIRAIDRELNRLGGTAERLDTAAAIPEGRPRQQAQPLRRHGRSRRGAGSPGVLEHRRETGRGAVGYTEQGAGSGSEMP